VCRATNTGDLFFREAKAHGFWCDKVQARDFLPPPAGGWDDGGGGAHGVPGGGAATDEGGASPSGAGGEPVSGVPTGGDPTVDDESWQPSHRGWPSNVRSRYDLEVYAFGLDKASPHALRQAAFVGLGEGSTVHLPY
jgi:hypothetical protein